MLIFLATTQKKIKNTLLRMKLLLNEPQREHNTGFASLLADIRANTHKQRTQSPKTLI